MNWMSMGTLRGRRCQVDGTGAPSRPLERNGRLGPRGSRVAVVTDPAKAPFAAVRLDDVVVVTDIDPDYPDATDGDFHLVRRHFDIRSFGVNGITGGAGDEMVEPHHEADDEENGTNGHEELFAVASGHAVFTVDGQDIDAPAGTLVFVRDPA